MRSLGVQFPRRASDGDRAFGANATTRARREESDWANMSSVNFVEAMETLKSMFPELDTVTVRDVLDKHGGFMEGAVEELLGISRAKRGMGGGSGGGRIGAHGDDDDGYGGGGGRDDRYGGNDGGFGGGSDGPPRSNQMDGYGRGQGGRCVSTRARATTTLGTPRRREIRGCLARHRVARDPRPRSPDPSRTTTFFPSTRAPRHFPGLFARGFPSGTRVPVCKMCQLTFPTPRRSLRSDYYSSQPPPEEEGSIWSWLTGADDEPSRSSGGHYSNGSGGYGTSAADDDDTFAWLANSANFYAGELSRNVKAMTDALAEELLGPAEDEEGEEIEEEDSSVRGNGEVVAGGATVKVDRRAKKKEEAPKPKPKPKKRLEEEEDDDDVIGGVLNLLGLEDDEEEEVYVRRDTKKDK